MYHDRIKFVHLFKVDMSFFVLIRNYHQGVIENILGNNQANVINTVVNTTTQPKILYAFISCCINNQAKLIKNRSAIKTRSVSEYMPNFLRTNTTATKTKIDFIPNIFTSRSIGFFVSGHLNCRAFWLLIT